MVRPHTGQPQLQRGRSQPQLQRGPSQPQPLNSPPQQLHSLRLQPSTLPVSAWLSRLLSSQQAALRLPSLACPFPAPPGPRPVIFTSHRPLRGVRDEREPLATPAAPDPTRSSSLAALGSARCALHPTRAQLAASTRLVHVAAQARQRRWLLLSPSLACSPHFSPCWSTVERESLRTSLTPSPTAPSCPARRCQFQLPTDHASCANGLLVCQLQTEVHVQLSR